MKNILAYPFWSKLLVHLTWQKMSKRPELRLGAAGLGTPGDLPWAPEETHRSWWCSDWFAWVQNPNNLFTEKEQSCSKYLVCPKSEKFMGRRDNFFGNLRLFPLSLFKPCMHYPKNYALIIFGVVPPSILDCKVWLHVWRRRRIEQMPCIWWDAWEECGGQDTFIFSKNCKNITYIYEII